MFNFSIRHFSLIISFFPHFCCSLKERFCSNLTFYAMSFEGEPHQKAVFAYQQNKKTQIAPTVYSIVTCSYIWPICWNSNDPNLGTKWRSERKMYFNKRSNFNFMSSVYSPSYLCVHTDLQKTMTVWFSVRVSPTCCNPYCVRVIIDPVNFDLSQMTWPNIRILWLL